MVKDYDEISELDHLILAQMHNVSDETICAISEQNRGSLIVCEVKADFEAVQEELSE